MTKLLAVQNVTVNWNKNYANTPDLSIGVDIEKYMGLDSKFVYKKVYTDQNADFLYGNLGGIVRYGIYYKEGGPKAFRTQFHKPINFKIETEMGIEEVPYVGYSSSRATIFNMLVGSTDRTDPAYKNSCFEVGLTTHNAEDSEFPRLSCPKFSGCMSMQFLEEVVAPAFKEQDIYILVCTYSRESTAPYEEEDKQFRLIPSLSETEIVLPEDCGDWKTEALRKSHDIQFAA